MAKPNKNCDKSQSSFLRHPIFGIGLTILCSTHALTTILESHMLLDYNDKIIINLEFLRYAGYVLCFTIWGFGIFKNVCSAQSYSKNRFNINSGNIPIISDNAGLVTYYMLCYENVNVFGYGNDRSKFWKPIEKKIFLLYQMYYVSNILLLFLFAAWAQNLFTILLLITSIFHIYIFKFYFQKLVHVEHKNE